MGFDTLDKECASVPSTKVLVGCMPSSASGWPVRAACPPPGPVRQRHKAQRRSPTWKATVHAVTHPHHSTHPSLPSQRVLRKPLARLLKISALTLDCPQAFTHTSCRLSRLPIRTWPKWVAPITTRFFAPQPVFQGKRAPRRKLITQRLLSFYDSYVHTCGTPSCEQTCPLRPSLASDILTMEALLWVQFLENV